MIPSFGPWKYFLREVAGENIAKYPNSHLLAWYMLIEHYAGLRLSREADRLPAILGIARVFQQIFGVTFVAGLWAQDLHRGLLWWKYRIIESSHDTAGHGLTTSPSWSWVRAAGHRQSRRITFRWFAPKQEYRRISMTPIERLPSHTDMEIVDVGTNIQLWGIVRRVRISSSDHVRTAVFRIGGGIEHAACRVDSEFVIASECHMLVGADWTYEDTYKTQSAHGKGRTMDLRAFLLLRRLPRKRKTIQHPLNLGRFERIGMGAGPISDIEGLHGRSIQKKFLTLV